VWCGYSLMSKIFKTFFVHVILYALKEMEKLIFILNKNLDICFSY
jgi:hypothetical protein